MIDNQRDNMRTYASSIAAKAISSHMYNEKFDYENETNYKIGMYSSKFNLLYGEKIDDVDFSKSVYQKKEALYVIDQSTHLHLGIKYIVLENTTLFEDIKDLKNEIILYTFFAMIFVAVIGYFLSRLFLKPIASEREKLDNFIKDTTHELNTPISALLMSVSSLKEDSKVKERIKVSSNRISNIYDDLCYLLKDDLNEQYEPQNINLKKIIEEQLVLLEGYIKSKKIKFQLDMTESFIVIDKESATRLINNIITNALKYSKPNNKIKIVLKENYLIVQDFGIGIDAKSLKQIKNRYYRANTAEGGFGIGLDIVNSICSRYKIEFTVESKKDEGTLVKLLF
jgi:two-component system OmpR family sensor kinase